MCRFIFYLGPSITLSALVTEPSHGLLQQSLKAYCPRASLNADGFGLAWYVPEISPIPAVYKEVSPAWSNPNLKQIARVTKSKCILAHVRAASTGSVVQTNCHPFSYKNLSFMHNGTIAHFAHIKRKMQASLSQSAFDMIQGTTDSELMFAMFITNFERFAGIKERPKDKFAPAAGRTCCVVEEPYNLDVDWTDTMARALQETIAQVHRYVLEFENEDVDLDPIMGGSGSETGSELGDDGCDGASLPTTQTVSRLNLCVTDGKSVVVSRYTTGTSDSAHTLYWSRGHHMESQGGACHVIQGETPLSPDSKSSSVLVVSSEPLDEKYECAEVPPNHIVVAGPHSFGIFPVLC